MEDWLLNWTGFILLNTHAEIDGKTQEDGPKWIKKMYKQWSDNSDQGKKRKEELEENSNSIIYKLDPEELAILKEWQNHIKAIYGQYGDYKFIFESGGGMGTIVKVYSDLARIELDLTDVDKW
jgi:hypothetical protein